MSAVPTSSNLWAGMRSTFGAFALPARLVTVAVAMLAVALVCYMSFVPSKENLVYLLGGQEFNPAQLQAICQALAAEGLTGFRVEGTRLKVPGEQVAQYANALAKREALPTGFYSALEKAAEQSKWYSSSAQEDRIWELAKQKTLAQMIEGMPEVETASVLMDRSPARGLRSQGEVRATVTIKPRLARELSPVCIRKIRNIVAGSVANLPPENVAVVDLNGRALLELGANGTTSDDLLMRVKEFEEHYTWKIRNILAFLPDVMVTVSVELETRQRRTEQVLLPADEENASSEPRKQEPTGQQGVTANSAAALDIDESNQPAHEQRPAQQQTWEEHMPLAPKSVTVAVAVPLDIVATLGTTQAPEAGQNSWTAQIKERVASAIPSGVSGNIMVSSFPRTDVQTSSAKSSGTASLEKTWIPWTMTTAMAATLALTLLLSGWRLYQRRARRVAASPHSYSESHSAAHLAMQQSGESGERRRELIRIEKSPASRGRGPHLIQASISSFEDLRWLAPASLQAVMSAVDSRLWAPALRGASRELCERVLAHMPARAAVLLREEIEFPGPVRLGDVETAQQEILEVVRRLDHTGDLVLEGREEILHE